MKTSIFVLSALFASSDAHKITGSNKFLSPDLINELDKEVNDTNYLAIGTNIRTELQGQLRSFLNGEAESPSHLNPDGTPFNSLPGMSDRINEATRPGPGSDHMTTMPFTRLERHVEQRFTERKPYERYPAWILPGSEAILPKKSADLSLLDDETDLKGNFHYKPIYDPTREVLLAQTAPVSEEAMVQIEAESEARHRVRQELRQNLRAFLEREYKYPFDKFPATILPGSTAIMPKKSNDLDLYDGAYDDQHHLNHRSTYNPRTHSYDNWSLVQTDMQDDGEITVQEARIQAAQMQAQMDKAVADADEKRAAQQAQYEANINNNDPAAQLQGLMNAQSSLHRLTSAFSAKPNMDKVNGMAQKLGIPMTPELMQLGSNEAISNALVEIAVGMGKSESEIEHALD